MVKDKPHVPFSDLRSVVDATAQAALLSAVSNALAQGLTAARAKDLSSVDFAQLLHFVLLALLSTPPNYLWQRYLEAAFPADTEARAAGGHGRGMLVNTAVKFVLDQSLGAVFNTLLFIVVMAVLKGSGLAQAGLAIKEDFWPMLRAGYSFWPIVTLLNLTLVPFEQRMLVGGAAGMLWGIYISISRF